MKNPKSYLSFVNAVRARGGLPHFDLGGGVTNGLASVANPAGVAGQGTEVSGITGSLTPQSGYVSQLAPTQFLNYAPTANTAAANALSGQQQFNQNLGAEQNLAQTFLQEGQGQGPNPAQAALAQNTATNVANQAALAAGQRGASSNVGLLARQAAQAGAATQQAAVGQASTLQAQQELAAQQNAAGLQSTIGSQITGQQGANTNLLGTTANATNAQNQTSVANYNQMQGTNAATAAANATANQNTGGGLLGGLSSAVSSIFYEGGEVGGGQTPSAVGHYDEGGLIPGLPDPNGPTSFAGRFLNNFKALGASKNPLATGMSQLGSSIGGAIKSALTPGPQAIGDAGASDLAPLADAAVLAAKGGRVPAMVSPGEQYLPPADVKRVEKGANPLSVGERIPGTPKIKGDSLKNDTVPKTLEAGGIVIPNSVMQAKDAPSKAAQFVQAVQAKQGLKRKR